MDRQMERGHSGTGYAIMAIVCVLLLVFNLKIPALILGSVTLVVLVFNSHTGQIIAFTLLILMFLLVLMPMLVN